MHFTVDQPEYSVYANDVESFIRIAESPFVVQTVDNLCISLRNVATQIFFYMTAMSVHSLIFVATTQRTRKRKRTVLLTERKR